MQINTEARTDDVRALAVAMALGSVVGLTVGGAYLAGSFARSAVASPARAGAVSPHAALLAAAQPTRSGLPNMQVSHQPVTAIRSSVAFAGARDGDRRCLAQAVYYEARGESPTGQAAVAQVVLNRARLPSFPKTLCGVVYQRAGDACQFSFACNGAMRGAVDRTAWRRAQEVASRVLGGAAVAQVRGATMFQAVSAAGRSSFASGVMQVAQIGAHVFYRFTNHGAGSRFVGPLTRDDRVHATFASLEPQPVHVVFDGPTPAAQLPAGPAAVPIAEPTPVTLAPASAMADQPSTQTS